MAKRKTPTAGLSVTATGMVEAVAQDVELSMAQVKVAAQGAVAAVEESLGIRSPAKKRKPAVFKPKAKAIKAMTKPRAAKPGKKSKSKKRK